jgi:hypothetical protein
VRPTFSRPLLNQTGSLSWISQTSFSSPTFAGVIWSRSTYRDHLSERFDARANLQYPNNPAGTMAWVERNMEALLTNRVGKVLSALKRMRPWQMTRRDALDRLIGDVERNWTRIQYQEPWQHGLAVGSGVVGGV